MKGNSLEININNNINHTNNENLTFQNISNSDIDFQINESLKDFDYTQLLNKNKVDNLSLMNHINKINNDSFELDNSKENNLNFKKLSYHKIVNNIKDFNENLIIIHLLKIENKDLNINPKIVEKKNEKKIEKKLNKKNYYSYIFENITTNLKNNINEEWKVKYINYFNKTLKTKKQKIFLKNYFKKNKYKWDKKTIDKISKKLNISTYSVYKWNWTMVKKLNS